jgi:CRP/FNR family transcriptional regulator, dissimilatory nitrate respiration regulator
MIETLKNITLFSGLADDDLAKISAIASRRDFKKEEMIFHEGDKASGFYMVEKGKVKIFKLSFEGKEQILHIYDSGNAFGEVPVFAGKKFPASAMSLEESTIIYFPRDKFVHLITIAPELGMNFLADLARRLREFTVQIENLTLKEVPARLSAYFITLSQEQNNQEKITLPISRIQLSNLIGTTPETVSRILKKMMEASFIEVQGKTILIKDIKGIHSLSDSGSISQFYR